MLSFFCAFFMETFFAKCRSQSWCSSTTSRGHFDKGQENPRLCSQARKVSLSPSFVYFRDFANTQHFVRITQPFHLEFSSSKNQLVEKMGFRLDWRSSLEQNNAEWKRTFFTDGRRCVMITDSCESWGGGKFSIEKVFAASHKQRCLILRWSHKLHFFGTWSIT